MFEPKTQEAVNMTSEMMRAIATFIQTPSDENQDEVVRLLRLYQQMSQKSYR